MNLEDLLTVNITGIIAIAAIISPILVSLISSCFNLISKRIEYAHIERLKQFDTYRAERVNVFLKLLDSIGKLLANRCTDIEALNTLSCLYQAHAYSDDQLATTLKIFYDKLEAWNMDQENETLCGDCQRYATVVARDINRLLSYDIGTSAKKV